MGDHIGQDMLYTLTLYKIKQSSLLLKFIERWMADHFRALHFHSLAEQNEELRRRVVKLTQIQGYVQLLVDKLQKAERRQQILSSQNNLLRQQARQLQIKFSQNQSAHGEQMRYVFTQHDQVIQEKNRGLSMMASQVDQLQVGLSHADNEIKTQRIAMQRTVQEYELVFSKMDKERQEMEKDLQILYQTHQQDKMKHFSEKDGWAVEADRLRSIIQEKSFTASELGRQVGDLNQQLKMAQLQIRKLTDYNRQIQSNFQQRQRQTGDALHRQQQGIDLLRLQVEKLNNQNLNLRSIKSAIQQELQQVKILQVHLKNDNETFVTDNHRIIFLLEEADKENIFLREKHRQLQEYSTAQSDSLKTENLKLREQLNVINHNYNQRQAYLGTKQLQLKQILSIKKSLQIQSHQLQTQIKIAKQDLKAAQQGYLLQKQRRVQLQLQLKHVAESAYKAKQSLQISQQVLDKLKHQNSQLSAQNHVLNRQINNPRQLTKEYREQVDRMVKNFHEERDEQNKRHWLEKEKLREVYQYELKEKELEFARKVSQLEQELLQVRRLQNVVLRTTPMKGK